VLDVFIVGTADRLDYIAAYVDKTLTLIFVRIVEKDTLRHEISHHCVTPKSRDVGTYNGQNLRNEALHKPTQTAILHDKTLNMPLFRDAGIKHL